MHGGIVTAAVVTAFGGFFFAAGYFLFAALVRVIGRLFRRRP